MKATITDRGTLASLRPLEVADYLRATSWRKVREQEGRASYWLKAFSDGDEIEILLPLQRTLGDYPQRMGEVLAYLEMAEQRSQLEILSDLLTSRADVIRVRRQYPDVAEGTMPIDDAVSVFSSARDMMMAAACAAVECKPYYHARRFAEASRYVDGLRIGQTERGSYVVTIQSRVPPDLTLFDEDEDVDVEEPFERRVTATLATAVEAVSAAATETRIEAFERAVEHGVSANLLQALVGLSEHGEDHSDVSLSFTWSRVRRPDEDLPNDVSLPADAMAVIGEAARVLRETSPREDFELKGVVIRLDRDPDAQSGEVTILGPVEGELRKIRVELGPQPYHEAVHAHDDRLTVECYGELVKEGRSHRLRSARGFEITEDEDGEAEHAE